MNVCCAETSIPSERVISTLAEVCELGDNPGALRERRRRKGTVVVRVPELGTEGCRRLEGEIASYVSACGCGQGRVAGIVTLITSVLLVVTGVVPLRELGVRNAVFLYFALSFTTMLIGKMYGLLHARMALVRLCRDLTNRNTPSPKEVTYGSNL